MNDDQDKTWAVPSGTGIGAAPAKSLSDMVADARSKSKGQGVVQGSTIFFKNMAESISHSNRNLKIGLAFLTLSFVLVSVGIGYAFVKFAKRQQGLIETVDANSARTLGELKDVQVQQQELQRAMKLQIDSVGLSTEALRRENLDSKRQVEELKKHHDELVSRFVDLQNAYLKDREVIQKFIQQSSAPAPAK